MSFSLKNPRDLRILPVIIMRVRGKTRTKPNIVCILSLNEHTDDYNLIAPVGKIMRV